MIDVLLSFDTEDPIHLESDDALLRLCRTLSEAGVPGNFFLVGEKARILRERGRRDVLAALTEHEIDYHGNYWFEFPHNAMEYGDELDWDTAIAYGTEIELNGLHDVAEITGQWPTAWVQHQNNVSAVMPDLFRRLGVRAWNGGFGSGPMTGWLMDQVVLTRNSHVMSLQGSWGSYQMDPLNPAMPESVMDPETEFRQFQERFDAIAEKHGAVVPLGHPCCWVMAEWPGWYEWDEHVHYRPGMPYKRHTIKGRVPMRNPADIEAHFSWTRRACQWLAARADVHCTTFGEYVERHREIGTTWLTLEDIDTLAAASVDGPTHLAVAETTLSAAEVLTVFAHLFSVISRRGVLLPAIPVQRVLGPVESITPAGKVTVPRSNVFALASSLYDQIVTRRRIPGQLRARVDLGPAAAVMLFAAAWRQYRADKQWPEAVTVEPKSELPAAAAMEFFRAPQASSSHATPGFTPRNLAERVRRQSWSYRDFAGAPG